MSIHDKYWAALGASWDAWDGYQAGYRQALEDAAKVCMDDKAIGFDTSENLAAVIRSLGDV